MSSFPFSRHLVGPSHSLVGAGYATGAWLGSLRWAIGSANRPTAAVELARNLGLYGLAALCLMLGAWMASPALAAADGWIPGQGASPPPLAVADDTTAIKADDFLNSIGVCTHITQGEDNPTKVAECLKYIGIRGIRDDSTTTPATYQAFIDVYKASGAKVVLLSVNGNIELSMKQYEMLAEAGALLAAEGPNEPNNWHVTYQGKTSNNITSMPLALFQRDLYAAVKANPKLKGIPVFHSSEAGGSQPDNCGLQFLTIPNGAGTKMPDGTKYADYANTHNYVCDHLKGLTEDNIAWNAEDPTLKGKWDGLYVEYGHTWWGKGFDGYSLAQLEKLPRVTTETGWSTRAGVGGHSNPITEDQQGKLFVNLYLAAFKRGWSYTFIYMLRDSPGQGAWGMVRNDYTYKKSGEYLHNMTTILADKSSSFTPGKVNYTIPGKPVTVHDLLMQKSDGTFDLAVWGERYTGGSDNVTVNLGATFASVKVYDPMVGAEPIKTLTNVRSVPLTLSDHAFIIEIAPGKSGTPPGGARGAVVPAAPGVARGEGIAAQGEAGKRRSVD